MDSIPSIFKFSSCLKFSKRFSEEKKKREREIGEYFNMCKALNPVRHCFDYVKTFFDLMDVKPRIQTTSKEPSALYV